MFRIFVTMDTKHKPEIGKKYGTWTIISSEVKKGGNSTSGKDRMAYWLCQCECGREAWKGAHLLDSGKVQSCKSCCRKLTYKNAFSLSYIRRVNDRAKISGFEFDIDAEYVWQLYEQQHHKCALSDIPISFRENWHGGISQTASLDRIDNTKGYIKGNVQWLHKDVNNMKHVHDQSYFLELCRKITNNKQQ